MTEPMTRCVHLAVRVERAEQPNDTAHVRLYYPGAPSGSDDERLTGNVAPSTVGAPLPLVVVMPAVNVSADGYRWLAERLVAGGFVVATYNHVGELMPGQSGLSPGIDLGALTPEGFGSRPSATALGPLLAAVGELVSGGPFAGLVDLDRVAIGGHSAGGTVALENADPDWFPGVGAVFSYGSHTVPVAALGWPAGTVLPVAPVPTLLCAGELDGVIGASADRYGRTVGAVDHHPVARTFDEGVRATPSFEVTFAGANHLLVVDPEDPTSARGFLDHEPTSDPAAGRELLARGVAAFCDLVLCGVGTVAEVEAIFTGSVLVRSVRSRT